MRVKITLIVLQAAISLAFKSIYTRKSVNYLKAAEHALLFDCDGVIVETEELHRIAYNAAFDKFKLKLGSQSVVWTTEYYDILQNTVGGGKPKMFHYFNNEVKTWPVSTRPYKRAPETEEEKKALVDELQDIKTEMYCEIIENMASAREGVIELMDEAINNPNLKCGICSAATRGGFDKLVNAIVGTARLNKLDIIVAGDDVSKKKPDPMIYNVASQKLGIKPENCVVVEDSIVGLRAAKAAGMKCIITYTGSTKKEDFYGQGADAKIESLRNIKLEDIFGPIWAGDNDVLAKHRDPKVGESTESSINANVATSKDSETTDTTSSSQAATSENIITPKIEGWTPHTMIVKST